MCALGRAGALGFAAVVTLSAWLALRDLDLPGLYYDEAIQAVPAAEFLREGGRPLRIPGAKSVWLGGGWFPVLTQPYMGALKSQLLIPVFAAFDASVGVLRATTFAWGLAGCLFATLFAAQILGTPVALATAALLALDPSVLFVSRHDWGSFSLGLVCRCAGLWLAAVGLARRRPAWLAGAGLAFGLGLYHRPEARRLRTRRPPARRPAFWQRTGGDARRRREVPGARRRVGGHQYGLPRAQGREDWRRLSHDDGTG
jgi:hypothetical protein